MTIFDENAENPVAAEQPDDVKITATTGVVDASSDPADPQPSSAGTVSATEVESEELHDSEKNEDAAMTTTTSPTAESTPDIAVVETENEEVPFDEETTIAKVRT